MDILTIASQKGGAGKTTLSAHLAVEAERQGQGLVAVIDTDPQGSLADWWNQRQAETPHFAAVNVAQLVAHMATLQSHGIALVVIDTPPAFLPIIRATIQVADLVLIPARPSPHDLRAVGVVVEMAEQMKKPFCFVVNGATPRTTIALEAVQALAQHGPVAPVLVHQRIDFAGSMVDGRTVGEINATSRSAEEITQLWTYVHTQLRKHVRRSGHGSSENGPPGRRPAGAQG
jgi:chromosome partitioning protein